MTDHGMAHGTRQRRGRILFTHRKSHSMYTLHPLLSDERINISRHELGHAVLGHMCGYQVDGIELGAARGCTLIHYGVSPATLACTQHSCKNYR
jgi:hypothetical protein